MSPRTSSLFTATYALAMAPVIAIYRRLRETGKFEFDVQLDEKECVITRDWLDEALGLSSMLETEAATVDRPR
jgi:hypothetical protein